MALQIGGLCPLLQVFDMPTSIAFYRDTLGFTPLSPIPDDDQCDWVLLGLDESRLMLNTRYESDQRPARPDPRRISAHNDLALFFSCADVDAAYAYLRSRGIEPSPPANQGYGMRQTYFRDPDGFEICFQHPVREQQ